MKYISAQPETRYYEWQVETMIYSFLDNGVHPNNIIILLGKTEDYSFDRLRKKYKGVTFASYPYIQESNYLPAIKPYLMARFFGSCACKSEDQYYYCDADTILTKPLPIFDKNYVYCSDTKNYIGYNYIISKGEEILDIMANTVKIDKRIIKERQEDSGGGQFIFSGTDEKFWNEVYKNSIKLYTEMSRYNANHIKLYEGTYPIQAWTAEMWATLWQFWKAGMKTRIVEQLDFAWSTDEIARLDQVSILHNAGITSDEKFDNFFKKTDYRNSYPPMDLDITKSHCSYYYYRAINDSAC